MECRRPVCQGTASKVLVIALSLIGLIGCNSSDDDFFSVFQKNLRYDTERFIVDKLAENRVVMLGDAGHGVHLFMRTPVAALNHWLDRIEQGAESLPRHVVFALEMDSSLMQQVKDYVVTGDPYEFTDIAHLAADQFTLGVVEFFHDIRSISLRADSLNATRSSDDRLKFELLGPEMVLDLENWSFDQRNRFFLYERDSISAGNILSKLKRDPACHILMYYGSAHLYTGPVTKQIAGTTAAGFYIAHYLEDSLRNSGGFYAIGQDALHRTGIDEFLIDDPDHSTAVVERPVFADVIRPDTIRLSEDDAFVVCLDEFESPRPVHNITSSGLIEIFFDALRTYQASDNDYHRVFVHQAIRYLTRVSGIDPDLEDLIDTREVERVLAGVEHWRQTYEFDAIAEVVELRVCRRLIDRLAQSESGAEANRWARQVAVQAGFDPVMDTAATPAERAEWLREDVEMFREKIRIEQLIGLAWVGTRSERTRALDTLKELTGESFATAKEWSVWWRENERRF